MNSTIRYISIGLWILSSVVTMFNTTFLNNTASTGGAMQLTSSIMTLENCELAGNIVTSKAGAIYVENIVTTVTIIGCKFTNNIAVGDADSADIVVAESANLVVKSPVTNF